jgi:HK97 family phage prohead protease
MQQNTRAAAIEERVKGSLERRSFTSELEVRGASNGMRRFSGYAIVFGNTYAVGPFDERIMPGALRRCLGEGPDVVLNLDHGQSGSGLPLARTKSGTLTLTEDARGMRVEAVLDPSDPDVQLIEPKMRRGDLTEMSFSFRATDDSWTKERARHLRTVNALSVHRGDVSIVTAGANDQTTASLRSRAGRRAAVILPSVSIERARARRAKALARERRDNPYTAAEMQQLLREGKAILNANGEPSFPTKTRQDLLNAIHAVGRASIPQARLRAYLKRRARELGAPRLIPAAWS